MELEESSTDTLNCQKDEQVGPETNKPETSLKIKMTNWSHPTLGTLWKGRILWKDNNAKKYRRQQEEMKTKSDINWLHKSRRHEFTGAE